MYDRHARGELHARLVMRPDCADQRLKVNMEKLLEKSDINTMKTLTNTWGVIKKKLRAGWEADAEPEVNVAPTCESD